MNTMTLKNRISSALNTHQRRILVVCLSGTLALGMGACNEDTLSDINEVIDDAELLAKTNSTDLSQFQTVDKNHGPFGFRQPGYVNQDAYITENIYAVDNLAYYGDWDSNRVYIIDVDNMTLLKTVENTGDGAIRY